MSKSRFFTAILRTAIIPATWLVPRVRGRLRHWAAARDRQKRRSQLARIRNRAELDAYIATAGLAATMPDPARCTAHRQELVQVVDALGITLGACDFLDLGPGFGDSLDVCQEAGARSITFVDHDPFFVAFNRVKGFATAFELDVFEDLWRLPQGEFDLIWCKGTVSADHFGRWRRRGLLRRWLTAVAGLPRPGGTVVICPHFAVDGAGETQIPAPDRSPFSHQMRLAGYHILPTLAAHNTAQFPVTFTRRSPK